MTLPPSWKGCSPSRRTRELGIRMALGATKNTPIALDTRDPIAYVAVSLILILAAVGAMFAPALRVAKSDPMQALRQE